jgi:peptide/nickel transport system substrate-binding protein
MRSAHLVPRRDVLKALVGLGGLGLLAACSGATPAAPAGTAGPAVGSKPAAPPAAAGTPRRGGILNGVQQNNWESFDPHRITSSAAASPEIYDTLVEWKVQPDGTLAAAPALAISWELKDESATFTLRQGVKFHDGSDWNADVAKYNIERLKDARSTARAFVDPITSAEVVDPYTLRLKLSAPAGSLLSNLSQSADARTYIISKEMAEKAGDKYGSSPETTAGSGPMKLVEWVSGSHHTVQRTGSHWQMGADNQSLPYLDTLKIRFVADDAVRFVELRSGNADVIDNVQAKDVPTGQQDPGIDLVENPYQVSAYQFNFSASNGPFVDNLKLRQAVHYAIDREAVARVLGQSIGAPMYYFLAPGYLGFDDSLPHYTFDPARARQLLAEAGYPGGVDIQISTINRAVDQQQAQILKQMLGEVGIRANLDVLERIAWTDKMATGQYEMGTFFTTMRPDPDSILAGRFESKQGKNYAQMSDQVMDQLLAKGRSSYDDAVRAAAYREVQQRIFDTAWYGTIWYRKYFDGYRKQVQGRLRTQEPGWNLRSAWLSA